MSERAAEDWLIRYLVVTFVAATALLAVIYGLGMTGDMTLVAGGVVGLVAASVVVVKDLQSWRTA